MQATNFTNYTNLVFVAEGLCEHQKESDLISISIREHRRKSTEEGMKWAEDYVQAANCRAVWRSEMDFRPAIRCLHRVGRSPLRYGLAPGHTSAGGALGGHPDGACRLIWHHWQERVSTGGARDSKGSFALQRSLSRWRRMRSTTRGSVIKETIRMRAPQAQIRGSASKIFLIRRAQVLRASLEKSELSPSSCGLALASVLSPSAQDLSTLPRFE
jgi:hypothetical protein